MGARAHLDSASLLDQETALKAVRQDEPELLDPLREPGHRDDVKGVVRLAEPSMERCSETDDWNKSMKIMLLADCENGSVGRDRMRRQMSIQSIWVFVGEIRARLPCAPDLAPREPLRLEGARLAICDDNNDQWRSDPRSCPISGRMLSTEEMSAEKVMKI